MRRFKNILAVYGDKVGADAVFAKAVELARQNDAQLTLVDTVTTRHASPRDLEERRKRLNRLIPAVKAEGVDNVSVDVLVGTPFLEIIRQVLKAGHDLVIASADGGVSFNNVYFGSTATHLMRKCPCPVWIIKPDQAYRYSKILACIDPETNHAQGNELDIKILDLATSLASANQAELHVVHAWEVEGKDRDTVSSEVRDDAREAILLKHETVHRKRVNALFADRPQGLKTPRLHLPRNLPQKAIINLVDTLDIDLIVMGTVSRTGISGLIIGNAAETILSAVTCGMLTVKPEGFVTPVAPEHERVREPEPV